MSDTTIAAEMAAARLSKRATSLDDTAAFVIFIAIIMLLGGVISGWAVAAHKEQTCAGSGFSQACTDGHPWMGVGITIIASGVVTFALWLLLALAARAYAAKLDYQLAVDGWSDEGDD